MVTTRTRHQEPLEWQVLRFIKEHRLVLSQLKLLVAVSGGPDSVCLLHILVRLRGELGIKLHVAHLNHQLRGADSEADAQHVSDLACRLGVPATVERREVKTYQARQRISLEEAAREVRYAFLAQVAKSVGASRVVVGHTVDDHIETILMHLIRGTGIKGLCGLQPCTEWHSTQNGTNLTIVRPLLQVSRQETVGYCHNHQLIPRIDASNLSLSPLRTTIRHQLLPLLQSYNPRVTEALLRTGRIASDELAFLDKEIGQVWDELVQKQENTIILDKKRFCHLPSALQQHLLRAVIEKLLGNLKDIETRHIEEVMTALSKPAGKKISLPGGLIFSIGYNQYLLGLDPASLSPFPVLKGELPLKIPGEVLLPGWHIEATFINREQMTEKDMDFTMGALAPSETTISLDRGNGIKGIELPNRNLFTAYFDLNKTGDKVVVRSRQPGDRFQPLGMSQPKKLSEFMIDAKVPCDWRERIPLVCSPEHILWVVGWRIDDRVKVTQDTKEMLCLKFERTSDIYSQEQAEV